MGKPMPVELEHHGFGAAARWHIAYNKNMARSSRKRKPAASGTNATGVEPPEPAFESGDPRETGRSQGRIIDRFGLGEGAQAKGCRAELEEDIESGRHGANP